MNEQQEQPEAKKVVPTTTKKVEENAENAPGRVMLRRHLNLEVGVLAVVGSFSDVLTTFLRIFESGSKSFRI